MASIPAQTPETFLRGYLTADIDSTATTITATFFDSRTKAARAPLATTRVFTIDKGTSKAETIYTPDAPVTVSGVTTLTNCVRQVSVDTSDLTGGTGSSHSENAEIGCVNIHTYVGINSEILDGTNATGANDFRVGDETASDVAVHFATDATVDPKLYWDDSESRFKVSWGDDAPAAGDVDGVGIPVLTTVERDAITWPANGPIIYNSDTGEHQKRQGSAWSKNTR